MLESNGRTSTVYFKVSKGSEKGVKLFLYFFHLDKKVFDNCRKVELCLSRSASRQTVAVKAVIGR